MNETRVARSRAITIPIGLSSSGLPVGVQLVGGAYADSTILALTRLLERQARFTQTQRIPARAPSDNAIALSGSCPRQTIAQ